MQDKLPRQPFLSLPRAHPVRPIDPNNNVCGMPCVLVATFASISDSRAPAICAASLNLSLAILTLPVRRTSVVSSTSCPRGAMGRHAHRSNATRRRARCKGRLWRYDATAP